MLNVVPGLGEIPGRALGLHPDVDAVSFTGSAEVGRLILTYAAQSNLKRIVLECGGKSPEVVMPDMAGELQTVAEDLAVAAFTCAGQNCTAAHGCWCTPRCTTSSSIGWSLRHGPGQQDSRSTRRPRRPSDRRRRGPVRPGHIANDTSYGLAATVWSRRLDNAVRLARGIRAGTVSVNGYGEGDLSTPFGGYRQSGLGGRDKSLEAFDQYTELKTIWVTL